MQEDSKLKNIIIRACQNRILDREFLFGPLPPVGERPAVWDLSKASGEGGLLLQPLCCPNSAIVQPEKCPQNQQTDPVLGL